MTPVRCATDCSPVAHFIFDPIRAVADFMSAKLGDILDQYRSRVHADKCVLIVTLKKSQLEANRSLNQQSQLNRHSTAHGCAAGSLVKRSIGEVIVISLLRI